MRGSRRVTLTIPAVLCGFLAAGLVLSLPALADVTGGDFKLKAPDVFEHTVDFMVTLSLGLFALVGYFAKNGLPAPGCKRTGATVALVLFSVVSFISLLFAYLGRLDVVGQLASGGFDYTTLYSYVVQAWTLLLAGIIAAVFVFLSL